MTKFTIRDTGVFRADPYVVLNELQEPVAQSYPDKNGGHYKHGLDQLTDYIATLEALLKEAGEKLKPFADEPILPEFDDDLYKDTQIQVMHFRRAAEVSKKIRELGGEA